MFLSSRSVKHSGDIGDARDKVNGSSRNDHSRFTGKAFRSSTVNLVGCDGVDLGGVFLEGEVSEGLEVSSDFFETVTGVLKSHHDVHL